jgi:hypothetical protein
MEKIEWLPFIKAALERNPVCFNDLGEKDTHEVYNIIKSLPDESIYDSNRLALPDEVWNFKRGDGIEKALLLADIIIQRVSSGRITIHIRNEKVSLESGRDVYHFSSGKNFRKTIEIKGREIHVK